MPSNEGGQIARELTISSDRGDARTARAESSARRVGRSRPRRPSATSRCHSHSPCSEHECSSDGGQQRAARTTRHVKSWMPRADDLRRVVPAEARDRCQHLRLARYATSKADGWLVESKKRHDKAEAEFIELQFCSSQPYRRLICSGLRQALCSSVSSSGGHAK